MPNVSGQSAPETGRSSERFEAIRAELRQIRCELEQVRGTRWERSGRVNLMCQLTRRMQVLTAEAIAIVRVGSAFGRAGMASARSMVAHTAVAECGEEDAWSASSRKGFACDRSNGTRQTPFDSPIGNQPLFADEMDLDTLIGLRHSEVREALHRH